MRQLLVLFVLILLMQVAVRYGVPADSKGFDPLTLITTGFILIGAYSMGELFRRMRLPALLGYLGAGIMFGPKLVSIVLGDAALAPISESVVPQLGLVNVLAVGVIGTMGGGEIKLPDLRENFGKLTAICAAVFVLVLPIITALVFGLTFVAPGLVPFLADLPIEGRIAGALLFGALAVGMSPAATLALLQEVRAHGRFTSLVLGVVVMGDLVLVATFLLILALARLLVSPEGLSLSSLAHQLPHIGAEFGWAIAVGVCVGVLFILYLRFVRREVLLFSLVVVFVTSFVTQRLHAETLLAFLIAGFVVQNFSRHGHTLIEAFERISLPVFVIYFTTQAASLDLVAVTVYLPLTLILVAVRCSLFVVGIGFGARKVGIDDFNRRHLQLSFFSQGGVDLVLAQMVADQMPAWGAQVQTVTVATILFYVIGGPPFLARALDAVGESKAARERGEEQLETLRTGEPSAAEADHELVTPTIEDPILQPRLVELREVLADLRARYVEGQILARARRRSEVVSTLAERIRRALEVDSATEASRSAAQLDAEIAELDLVHEQLQPFDGHTLSQLFRELDAAQRYGESHRIVRTPDLFEPRGGRVARALRFGRRIRRAIAGPGMRTVPIGRLWRFHVSLELPVELWRSTRPAEAELWHELLDHYRLTREHLDALAMDQWASIRFDEPRADAGHGHGHDGEGDGGHDGESGAEAKPQAPTLAEWLADSRARASARTEALRELAASHDRELERGLARGLARAWASFVDAVELAGTLERPAWRYRPSARYDPARAATANLLESASNDRERAAGRHDALSTIVHARNVARAIRAAADEFEERFVKALFELRDRFEHAVQYCRALPAELDDPASARERIGEEIDVMVGHVEHLRRQLAVIVHLDPVALRHAVTLAPESLAPSSDLAEDKPDDPRRTLIRLRAWLSQTIVSDFNVARSAASDEFEAGLLALRQALVHVTRVAAYHLGPNTSELDSGLGERLANLLVEAREQVTDLGDVARVHVDEKIEQAEQAALGPILAHRWDEIRRRHRQLDVPQRAAVVEWLRERQQQTRARVGAAVGEIADEVEALFADRPTQRAWAAWREALFGPRSSMPEAYQRLFTSVPAESVGLLIRRPELELLLDHAQRSTERWPPGPLLVHGDRGAGKRTLVRQILAELGDGHDVHWLRLSPALDRERDIVHTLLEWFGPPSDNPPLPSDFDLLSHRLRTLNSRAWPVHGATDDNRRTVIVVENTERLFRRNPEGLARVRRFLELIASTRDQLFWIVLIAEPAVAVLDAAVELRARFPRVVQVPPMGVEQLEQVLDIRHRLSGYGLRLEPGTPSLGGWIRGPGTAWQSWRQHEAATFERLAQLSGGNVRQALRLWLAAARNDDADPSTVIVGPLPADTCPLLDELPLSSRVLLAGILLHGPLRRSDLDELHTHNSLDLDTELARLTNLGLVAIELDSEQQAIVTIETRLVQPLTRELRACNLL